MTSDLAREYDEFFSSATAAGGDGGQHRLITDKQAAVIENSMAFNRMLGIHADPRDREARDAIVGQAEVYDRLGGDSLVELVKMRRREDSKHLDVTASVDLFVASTRTIVENAEMDPMRNQDALNRKTPQEQAEAEAAGAEAEGSAKRKKKRRASAADGGKRRSPLHAHKQYRKQPKKPPPGADNAAAVDPKVPGITRLVHKKVEDSFRNSSIAAPSLATCCWLCASSICSAATCCSIDMAN